MSLNINLINATVISGATFYSGITPMHNIFAPTQQVNTMQNQLGTFVIKSGDTMPGILFASVISASTLTATTISANTLSASTIQSNSLIGGTTQMVVANTGGVLSVQAIPAAGQSTIIRNGLNTYTGGSTADYTVNVSGLSIDNIFVSGTSRYNSLSASTLSGGTIYSGNTDLSSLFGSTTAVSTLQSQMLTKINRSGDTFTGQVNASLLSATTISGDTYYSGNTSVESIIYQIANASKFLPISGGTGGQYYLTGSTTATTIEVTNYIQFDDTVSVTPPISAATLYVVDNNTKTVLQYNDSNGTPFRFFRDNLIIVRNQTGSNLTKGQVVYVTGSTGNIPRIALAKADNQFTAESTGLLFENINNNSFGYVMTMGIITNLNTSSYNAGDDLYLSPTISGGLTNIKPEYPNFSEKVGKVLVSGVGNGSILVQTEFPVKERVSGSTFFVNETLYVSSNAQINGQLVSNSLSATTISGGTIYSGNTNLYSIFATIGSVGGNSGGSTINNGINAFTAGTSTFQSINITGLSIDNIFVSGTSRFNSLSASTLSGGTIYSGSTDLSSLFATPASVTNAQTFVQPGLNTYTGGTNTRPTVNVSALTIDTLTVTGNTYLANMSGTSANLTNDLQVTGTTYTGKIRIVSPATPQIALNGETSTGFHFDGNNRISLHNNAIQTFIASSAGTMAIGTFGNVNENYKLHVSGASLFEGSISANTLSASTIQSRSLTGATTQMVVADTTGLLSVQAIPTGGGSSTAILNGLNTYTGGTGSAYTVNISGLSIDNIFVSGTSRYNSLSASTLSGGTIYSGNTELSSLFITNLTGAVSSSGNVTSLTPQTIANIRAITTLRI